MQDHVFRYNYTGALISTLIAIMMDARGVVMTRLAVWKKHAGCTEMTCSERETTLDRKLPVMDYTFNRRVLRLDIGR